MDKIECIRIFVETAQLNSFTATANKLNMTQGAVSKKIAWLESDLGMTLFQRNSRKISLTHIRKRLPRILLPFARRDVCHRKQAQA